MVRNLLLSNGSAIGVHKSIVLVLSPSAEFILIMSAMETNHCTHLTRFVPIRFRKVVQDLVAFRNKYSTSPFIMTESEAAMLSPSFADRFVGRSRDIWRAIADVSDDDGTVIATAYNNADDLPSEARAGAVRSRYSTLSLCPSGKRLLFTSDVYFAPSNTTASNTSATATTTAGRSSDPNLLLVVKHQHFVFPLAYAPTDLLSIYHFSLAERQFHSQQQQQQQQQHCSGTTNGSKEPIKVSTANPISTTTYPPSPSVSDVSTQPAIQPSSKVSSAAVWSFRVHSTPIKVSCQQQRVAVSAHTSFDFFEYILPELSLLAHNPNHFPVFVRKYQKHHESTFKSDIFGESYDLGSILSRHDGEHLLTSEVDAEMIWITHELSLTGSFDYERYHQFSKIGNNSSNNSNGNCNCSSNNSNNSYTEGIYRWNDGVVDRGEGESEGLQYIQGHQEQQREEERAINIATAIAAHDNDDAMNIDSAEGIHIGTGTGEAGDAPSCFSTPEVEVLFVYTGVSGGSCAPDSSSGSSTSSSAAEVECWITFEDEESSANQFQFRSEQQRPHIAIFSLLDGDFLRLQIHYNVYDSGPEDDRNSTHNPNTRPRPGPRPGPPSPARSSVDITLHLSLFLVLHGDSDSDNDAGDADGGDVYPIYTECDDLHAELIPDLPWLRLLNAAHARCQDGSKDCNGISKGNKSRKTTNKSNNSNNNSNNNNSVDVFTKYSHIKDILLRILAMKQHCTQQLRAAERVSKRTGTVAGTGIVGLNGALNTMQQQQQLLQRQQQRTAAQEAFYKYPRLWNLNPVLEVVCRIGSTLKAGSVSGTLSAPVLTSEETQSQLGGSRSAGDSDGQLVEVDDQQYSYQEEEISLPTSVEEILRCMQYYQEFLRMKNAVGGTGRVRGSSGGWFPSSIAPTAHNSNCASYNVDDTGVVLPAGMKECYIDMFENNQSHSVNDSAISSPSSKRELPRKLIQLVNTTNGTVLTQLSSDRVRGKFPGRVLITYDGITGYLRGMLPGGEEVFLTADECLAATPEDYSYSAMHASYFTTGISSASNMHGYGIGVASTSAKVAAAISPVMRQNLAMDLQSHHRYFITSTDTKNLNSNLNRNPNSALLSGTSGTNGGLATGSGISPSVDAGISVYFLQCAKKLLSFYRYVLLPPAGRQQYWNDVQKCHQYYALQRHQHMRERELAAIRQQTVSRQQRQREENAKAVQRCRQEEAERVHQAERERAQALLMKYINSESDPAWQESQWARAKNKTVAVVDSTADGATTIATTTAGASDDYGRLRSRCEGRNMVTPPEGSLHRERRQQGSSLSSVQLCSVLSTSVSTLGFAETESFQSSSSRDNASALPRPPIASSTTRGVNVVTPTNTYGTTTNNSTNSNSSHSVTPHMRTGTHFISTNARATVSPYYEYHHTFLHNPTSSNSAKAMSATTPAQERQMQMQMHPTAVPVPLFNTVFCSPNHNPADTKQQHLKNQSPSLYCSPISTPNPATHNMDPQSTAGTHISVYSGCDFTPLSSTYGRRYSQEVYMRDKIAGAKLFARDAMADTQELLKQLRPAGSSGTSGGCLSGVTITTAATTAPPVVAVSAH